MEQIVMPLAIHSKKSFAKRIVLGLALLAISSGAVDDMGQPLGRSALAAEESTSLAAADPTTTCAADPRVQLGLVTQDICVGAELFFREPFNGNGRTCGTCHPPDNNFTIDPTSIAALAARSPNDPLFIAERPAPNPLAQLERPDLMRQFGLILENVDGLQSPTTKFVMRSVPHTLSLATSVNPALNGADGSTIPPNERTGWSGDGAPGQGALRDFQTGAIIQHYTKTLNRVAGTDFRLATSVELGQIEAFMRTIGRTNELNLAASTFVLNDADAQVGRGLFLDPANRCNGCHSNAGANIATGVNFNFNTGIEAARVKALNQQGIPVDGGFGATQLNPDGSFGNGTFNTPPLIEAADTGPFFHTNAFNTIEDAIGFYKSNDFRRSPAGAAGGAIQFSTPQGRSIGRFLRVLNAGFNCQMAIKRIDGVIAIIDGFGNQSLPIQTELLRLAQKEVSDAIAVLSPLPGFNPDVLSRLNQARDDLASAMLQTVSAPIRKSLAQTARNHLIVLNNQNGNGLLGTGLMFVIGAGTLMF